MSLENLTQNTIKLVGLFKLIKSDLRSYYPNGSLYKYVFLAYFSPSLKTIIYYRIGRFLFLRFKRVSFFHTYLKYKMYKIGGNEISFRAQIGTGFKLAHPTGVIIGDKSIIGNNVIIFQQVTLGSHGKEGLNSSYPIIEDNVTVYAGAKIIGNVRLGTGSIIGANSVINIDVPENSIGVGIPCKIVNKVV